MGREFTNALQQTPLWNFALSVYSPNKDLLLSWQEQYNANVNDLIAIAYVTQHAQSLPPTWWQVMPLAKVRALTQQCRQLRISLNPPLYEKALEMELMLEGIDIQILQSLMTQQIFSNIEDQYERHLKIKRGALAPLIQTLVSSATPE